MHLYIYIFFHLYIYFKCIILYYIQNSVMKLYWHDLAQHGSERHGSVQHGLRFHFQCAELFTCRYNAAASSAVTPEKRFHSTVLQISIDDFLWPISDQQSLHVTFW